MGPTDEDEDYYQECLEIVTHASAFDTIEFTGRVNIEEYLPKVDIMVLTSISEGQPLVILEAGAAGIPSVATNVGACSEMIYGRTDEQPNLGDGGMICPLSSPYEVANALHRLITDKEYYDGCCVAIKNRVKKYYNKERENTAYRKLYESMLQTEETMEVTE
jgi:glycosyltransferase involved in cell wall biosynthesis